MRKKRGCRRTINLPNRSTRTERVLDDTKNNLQHLCHGRSSRDVPEVYARHWTPFKGGNIPVCIKNPQTLFIFLSIRAFMNGTSSTRCCTFRKPAPINKIRAVYQRNFTCCPDISWTPTSARSPHSLSSHVPHKVGVGPFEGTCAICRT